ncbi:hypothetical protein [Sphingobacterium sp. LRF_L2]|uniref:hypothetical protein n=1 Tax=Sphingobacterium sp. LRF_L2 TaxID=3369421 RepID=UPI003F6117F2
MLWLGIAIVAALGIAWEDFRWRMVHLWWYPMLLIGLCGLSMRFIGIYELLLQMGFNLVFVGLLLLLLTLYFSVKEGKLVFIFDRYLGWGDVLFFLAITPYFDLQEYILFTILTLIVSLIFTPLFFHIQGKDQHIPLAGMQSACLLLYLPATFWGWFALSNLFQR